MREKLGVVRVIARLATRRILIWDQNIRAIPLRPSFFCLKSLNVILAAKFHVGYRVRYGVKLDISQRKVLQRITTCDHVTFPASQFYF